MIEYITETGIFGYFWVILLVALPIVIIGFFKNNGFRKLIEIILPLCLILFIINFMSEQLIGKTQFDMALTLSKDLWFLIGHTLIISFLLFFDKDSFERGLEVIKIIKHSAKGKNE